jgi:hypothetical protein
LKKRKRSNLTLTEENLLPRLDMTMDMKRAVTDIKATVNHVSVVL